MPAAGTRTSSSRIRVSGSLRGPRSRPAPPSTHDRRGRRGCRCGRCGRDHDADGCDGCRPRRPRCAPSLPRRCARRLRPVVAPVVAVRAATVLTVVAARRCPGPVRRRPGPAVLVLGLVLVFGAVWSSRPRPDRPCHAARPVRWPCAGRHRRRHGSRRHLPGARCSGRRPLPGWRPDEPATPAGGPRCSSGHRRPRRTGADASARAGGPRGARRATRLGGADRLDQRALAHGACTLDAETACELLQLGQQHRAEPTAALLHGGAGAPASAFWAVVLVVSVT